MEIRTWRCEYEGGWKADVVDHEGEGPTGAGATEMAALVNLAEKLWAEHDDALFDCLAYILEWEANASAKRARENGYSSLISAQADGWAGGLNQAARTVRGIV